MNEQVRFWQGAFGDDYTLRNRVDIDARVPFWRGIVNEVWPASVIEVGCNAGWNLAAIKRVSPRTTTYGIDVNASALDEAAEEDRIDEILCGEAVDVLERLVDRDVTADLVFSAGVMIHVAPGDLRGLIGAMRDASHRYVLAVEYADDQEVEVNYRGHSGRLWRRPYGDILSSCGLRVIDSGDAPGFDDCQFWLCERSYVEPYA